MEPWLQKETKSKQVESLPLRIKKIRPAVKPQYCCGYTCQLHKCNFLFLCQDQGCPPHVNLFRAPTCSGRNMKAQMCRYTWHVKLVCNRTNKQTPWMHDNHCVTAVRVAKTIVSIALKNDKIRFGIAITHVFCYHDVRCHITKGKKQKV